MAAPQAIIVPSEVIINQIRAKTEGDVAATTDMPSRINSADDMNNAEVTVHAVNSSVIIVHTSDLAASVEVQTVPAQSSTIS